MPLDWPQMSRFSTPEDSTGFLLWQVQHMWQRRATRGLSKLGITHMQFTLLAGVGWLARNGDLPSQSALAAHCQVDAMSVSQVVNKLENKRLLKRSSHPGDPRAKALSLTKQGTATLSKALREIERMDDAFFAAANRKRFSDELMKLYLANSKDEKETTA